MTEFGHIAHRLGAGRVDYWGAGPFLMLVNGQLERFEDSDQFGPWKLGVRGEPLTKQWGGRHPFWRPYHIWRAQGRRLAADGQTCIWHEPKPMIATRVGKRHAFVNQAGEEYGEEILREAVNWDPSKPGPVIHFVGFRGEEYWSAVRIWGRPHFIHRGWDRRAQREIIEGEIVVFARGDEHQAVAEHNFNDIDESAL